jgi:threonylcarbamoyladenosine tRNA methylthiotransferase MtaB
VANGYREIVLTGVHLGHYGVDWNWHKPKSEWIRLSDLVRRIVEIDGDFRIRLSSIEATEVTRELLGTMAAYPDKICPHLHICLQSGSDAVCGECGGAGRRDGSSTVAAGRSAA